MVQRVFCKEEASWGEKKGLEKWWVKKGLPKDALAPGLKPGLSPSSATTESSQPWLPDLFPQIFRGPESSHASF